MSCTHITAFRLTGSPPSKAFQIQHSKTSICPSTYLGTRFPKMPLRFTSSTSRYKRATIVSLFGSKGKSAESDNSNEGSPWKAVEKDMGNFKKNQPIEEVLRQQIQEQDYYDDGDSGGNHPGGSGGNRPGGGGGGGFGEGEKRERRGFWDELGHSIMATVGLIIIYIFILKGPEDFNAVAKDVFAFIFLRRKSHRIMPAINLWNTFLENMKNKPEYEDPFWLERTLISTTTDYDSPEKWKRLVEELEDEEEGESDDDFY
ncbi:glycine-rich family protein [Striga asiatica]|uniref:Glycine-rich family protein n=1 Tax=Striga asiatica TaxID=4170 RepID=A0A5A7NVH1_STRAF|nr:glycine-rich family protein [Striga asiatica]